MTGATTTNGITNTGNFSTTTLSTTGNATVDGALAVTGATTTNGITNTGNISTTTLSTTGNATVDGALGVTGNTNVGGSLGVAGNTTVGGNLAVTGATSTHGINNNNNKISGVANGTAPNDAVNYGQLETVSKMARYGVASAAAMANLPGIDAGKNYGLGVAFGSYKNAASVAAGASMRVGDLGIVKSSVGVANNDVTVGLGFGLSF